jgi:hypothetical protein
LYPVEKRGDLRNAEADSKLFQFALGIRFKRIVDARNFLKNIVHGDCLDADVVATNRLAVVVGIYTWAARDARV